MLRWLTFWMLQAFLNRKDILCHLCMMCDQLAIIYKYFAYANRVYLSVWSEMGHWCLRFFLPAKTLVMFFVQVVWLYLMRASVGLTSWITLKFHSYVKLEVSYMFRKVTTSLWPLVEVWNFLSYLYTCWGKPSILICKSNGLGWRFPVIDNMAVISCEPFLYRYT